MEKSSYFVCLTCKKKRTYPQAMEGQALRCPHCNTPLVADSETDAPEIEMESPFKKQETPPPPILNGKFKIIKKLAEGGMGSVYKGLDIYGHRHVAIKILPENFASEKQFILRFHRETEVLASLKHPNIVQLIARGEEQGLFYFVMEYIKGKDLSDLMEEPDLDWEPRCLIIRNICKGLDYAHQKGVIHRDIKPANVLISKGGAVKITDFGLARILYSNPYQFTLTVTGMVMGTDSYMAPEQKEDSKKVDHRADIYSLGVVLYEQLTGLIPEGRFMMPSELNPFIPEDLDQVVEKALHPSPDQRYQSAREIEEEIKAIVRADRKRRGEG